MKRIFRKNENYQIDGVAIAADVQGDITFLI